MHFSSFFTAIVLTFFSILSDALVLPRGALDVWSPKINSPNENTTWVMGTQVNVTWSTADAPNQISNGASVVLNGVWQTLAKGFDLRSGFVTVTVPYLTESTDDLWNITLFGDSGNISPSFRIVPSGQE